MRTIVTLALLVTIFHPKSRDKDPITLSGYLSYYDHGPTVGTIAYRQSVGDIPLDLTQYDGVIAVKDCGLVGKEAKLIAIGKTFDVIIFDCASRGDDGTRQWMDQNNILGEVGHFMREKNPSLAHSYAKLQYYP